MSSGGIRSGTLAEAHCRDAEWIIVDMGFAAKKASCGFLRVEANTEGVAPGIALTYAALRAELTRAVKDGTAPLNLVLEAPLSVAFDAKGNPIGRNCERRGSSTRYWYAGLGTSILVSSLYLLKALLDDGCRREVRLFEALVSFKDRSKASNHCNDVEAIRCVVFEQRGGRIVEARALNEPAGCRVCSILELLGGDPTPPPIFEVIHFEADI